jgi:hypothetical protein
MSKTYLKEAVPAARVASDLAGAKETVTGVIADIDLSAGMIAPA